MSVLPACMYVQNMCVCGALGGLRRALDLLGLELQRVMSHQVGALALTWEEVHMTTHAYVEARGGCSVSLHIALHIILL